MITLSNTTFKIKNADTGEYLTQKVADKTYSEWKTNDAGYVQLPLEVKAGNWVLEELESPNSYLINKDGQNFKVTNSNIVEVDEDGELLYGEAHIMCNLFSINALEKVSKVHLPYHVAEKKSNYMNDDEEFVEVTEPNAYKFEAFIFDAFNFFDDISILRGRREKDFAPVKNKTGNDSPETSRELYNNYWKNNK